MPEGLVSTGFAQGLQSGSELLERALHQALDHTHRPVSGVLALFSPAQFPLPIAALQSLARRLSCPQIRAGTFAGVISDQGSVLGQSACAILLFHPPAGIGDHAPLLLHWTHPGASQELPFATHNFGSIGSKISQFWQFGQLRQNRSHLQTGLPGPWRLVQFWSEGVAPLTETFPYFRQEGPLLLQLERYLALPLLARALPLALREAPKLPLEALLVVEEDAQGQHQAIPIVATDLQRSGLWLERPLHTGSRIFLAWRNQSLAKRETRTGLAQCKEQWGAPSWAWVSSFQGRGRVFFGEQDAALPIWREIFGDTPVLGCYDQGQWQNDSKTPSFLRFAQVFSLLYWEG